MGSHLPNGRSRPDREVWWCGGVKWREGRDGEQLGESNLIKIAAIHPNLVKVTNAANLSYAIK